VRPAEPAKPAPARSAPVTEPAKATDLSPGTQVVVTGMGLMQVVGPHDVDGKPGIHFTNAHTGDGMILELDRAHDPTLVRAVITKAEAARRLALLEDSTPLTDTRTEKQRGVELMRTLARGTDLEQLALLHAYYASTFSETPMMVRELEERVVPELAYVLGTPTDALVSKLHAIHAQHGTFSTTAKVRPPDPAFVPPKDPWHLAGHEYVGSFSVATDTVIAGDPIYATSKHDEPPQDVTKNVHITATPGRWLCYVELDPAHPDDVSIGFLAIHESAHPDLATARRKATAVGKLWVDSGQMSVVDAAIRDDASYDDARLFGADDGGIIRDRGCKVPSGGGDGTYVAHTVSHDGKAIYIHVDFRGDSRDFLQDARKKLK
jgi:hypothetical protein